MSSNVNKNHRELDIMFTEATLDNLEQSFSKFTKLHKVVRGLVGALREERTLSLKLKNALDACAWHLAPGCPEGSEAVEAMDAWDESHGR